MRWRLSQMIDRPYVLIENTYSCYGIVIIAVVCKATKCIPISPFNIYRTWDHEQHVLSHVIFIFFTMQWILIKIATSHIVSIIWENSGPTINQNNFNSSFLRIFFLPRLPCNISHFIEFMNSRCFVCNASFVLFFHGAEVSHTCKLQAEASSGCELLEQLVGVGDRKHVAVLETWHACDQYTRLLRRSCVSATHWNSLW